ncbi:nanos homolog 1-like [Scyliorhinus canicula]|uniref:nanos homolog 1-like n=1 Tax=Scyliorhinus canicula TaxID=7830 RepID=UPI0018F599CE|nr:nanos homolog 1-like [Scyliorhinus canicula]
MANRDFDMWTDYLGLSKVVESFLHQQPRESCARLEPLRNGASGQRDPAPRGHHHQPVDLSSHGLTLEMGTGLYLTINVKGTGRCSLGDDSQNWDRYRRADTIGGKSSSRRWTTAGSVGEASPVPGICTFCKQNGEPKHVYTSHVLKDQDRIVCPVLRGYTCPLCSATGDSAHTKRFCHLLRGNYRSMYTRASREAALGNNAERR